MKMPTDPDQQVPPPKLYRNMDDVELAAALLQWEKHVVSAASRPSAFFASGQVEEIVAVANQRGLGFVNRFPIKDPREDAMNDQPNQPTDGYELDETKKRLADCAVACLDHVRRVRWGQATSQYVLDNYDGLRIRVSITVQCFEKGAESGN
jgi:hypothetical protein